MRKSILGFVSGAFFLAASLTSILSSAQSATFTIPDQLSCSDIALGDKIYAASSSTNNGNVIHSLWLKNAFNDGTAKFDFTEGQLFHNTAGAELFGFLNLRTGGGTKNNSTWKLYIKYDPTTTINPKLELGQDSNLYETWIYYVLNSSESFLVDTNDESDLITFTHMGNPFQIGLSAGGKDLDEPSASGWFNWYRNGNSDQGDVNINIEDLCPPTEAISPILECVEVQGEGNYLARFGYDNNNNEAIIVPIGTDNKFTPSPEDREQPFSFLSGRQVDVFQVPFDGSNLVWTLSSPNGSTSTATASNNSEQYCDPSEEVCSSSSIDGGVVAFDGPYNPTGTNTIYNVELPSSEFEALGFEYIWMQSDQNEPNTPGNPHWSPIAGSENLTELEVSGLLQTTYFIRCARLVGCDTYWGETPTVTVEVDPCDPNDIDGGVVAFDGPYNPTGTNTIYNVELPSSPYADLGFEYIWMQSLTDVANTPGNPHWSPIAGTENLTELEVSGLLQTTYFIRCARLVGCDNYWGETPSVEVTVDPCLPAAIDGGEVAFNNPYDPNGTNTIFNVEFPSSPYADLGFEYIWMQSLTDVANTPGNPHWSPIAGTENLTELEVSGLLQTTYFIRCARLVGCDNYWGETPSVEVTVDPCLPAAIDGGEVAFNNPYDPNGTNTIFNVEFPSSPYADLGFEYIWMQSITPAANTPGNPHWSPIAGSENLTELEVSGLLQTTYFIRCARLVGCDTYWGETPTVTVEVDPCDPNDIDGGVVAFDGPYNPTGTNTIYNVELPSSPYADLGFEYIWMQSLTDVANTPGNPHWSPIAGTENLTELEVSGLLQTTYFIRCARLVGCDNYWGETPSVEVTVDPCLPAAIDGGEVAFNNPYDPNGTNTIFNVEFPSSPYADLGFEYIWMQSLTDVANTPGNPHWSPIAGTENLTELEVSGLLQTTYFIRCARLVGCDNYWGETPSVEVTVDPCLPAAIDGGEVAFNNPYDPNGTNTIFNVEFPSSPYADLGFEYIWMQNDENEPNVLGNTNWEVVSGSENQLELNIPTITDTQYFIRCVRLIGCDVYWGESNIVEVNGFAIPTAVISGGGEVCEGETASVNIDMTGVSPFTITYTDGTNEVEIISENTTISIDANEGVYTLISVEDFNYPADISGEAVVTVFERPTATLTGGGSICGDQTVELQVALSGAAPFTIIYSNGVEEITAENINENIYSIQATAGEYSLLSVLDANCTGNVSGTSTIIQNEIPTATLSGEGSVCGDQTVELQVALSGAAPFTVVYSNGVEEITAENINENIYSIQATAGEYSLLSVLDANCTGSVSGTASISQNEIPTATLSGEGSVCGDETIELQVAFTGTAPYIFVYSNGTEETTLENINDNSLTIQATAGEYSLVSISDVNCTGTVEGSVIISEFDTPTASISGSTVLCSNEVATITITLTGQGPLDLVYTDGIDTFDVTTSESTFEFEGTAGTYSLVSVSNGQCDGTVSGEAVISIADSPTASISTDGPVCEGQAATVTINFTGAGNWSATYTDGNTPTSITSNSDTYTFEAFSGTYTLLNVSDALCTGTVSGIATIDNIESPTAFISGGGTICARDLATIEFSFTGTGPWTYSYQQGRNTITANSENNTTSITTNQLGTYILISVSDALCTGTVSGSAEVTTVAIPSGEITIDENNCAGEEIILANDIEEANNTFAWSTTGSGTLINADAKLARYIAIESEQNVTFNLTVSNACSEVEFAAVTNFNSAIASFSINPTPDNGVLLSNVAYEFIADDINANTWEWDLGDGTQAVGNTIQHTYNDSGLYAISLTVGNLDCFATETLTVEVGENQNLFIPNVFSPRSTNAENSTLKVYGENISTDNFEFAVYNKWGQPVFRTNNLTDAQSIGWNGNSNSEEKGNNVFTYIVRGKFNNGEVFEETGAVTLVK